MTTRRTDVQSRRGDEDRCAICERGEGIHLTHDGRLVCNRCLTHAKAADVVELRKERRRNQ